MFTFSEIPTSSYLCLAQLVLLFVSLSQLSVKRQLHILRGRIQLCMMEKITWHSNSKSIDDSIHLKFDAPKKPWLRFLKSDPGRRENKDRLPTYVFEGNPLRPIQPLHGLHVADDHHSQSQDASISQIDADRLKFKRALKKVADLRDGLYGKRLKLKEKRNELRQELSILSEADAKFMKAVRQYCSKNQVLEEDFEEKYYTDMEQQRDVVGSLQYDYDQEEDEHDVAENELVGEEEKLSIMVSKFLDQGNDEEALQSNASSGRHLLPQETIYPPKTDKEVAIEEYQSRQGDARIMQERLADLLAEEDVRRSFAKKRENVGWGFVESEGDFAEEFNKQFREIESELGIIEADVKRLKDDLIQSGYLESEPASTIQPASLFSLPPIQPPPRIQAQSPVQVGRNRAKSDSIAPLVVREISTARVRESRVSQWILVTFGSYRVEQSQQNAILRDLEVEAIGGELLDEKKWTRTARLVFDRLKKHNELDDESRSSWDEIGQQDLLSYSPDKRASQPGDYVFLKGMLEVEQAVNRLEEQFPDKAERNDHTVPYGPSALRMDLHLEYESRSC